MNRYIWSLSDVWDASRWWNEHWYGTEVLRLIDELHMMESVPALMDYWEVDQQGCREWGYLRQNVCFPDCVLSLAKKNCFNYFCNHILNKHVYFNTSCSDVSVITLAAGRHSHCLSIIGKMVVICVNVRAVQWFTALMRRLCCMASGAYRQHLSGDMCGRAKTQDYLRWVENSHL